MIRRIATWNVNDIRKRLPLLLAWLDATKPDVVALQELKCTQVAFPVKDLMAAGYEATWVGQATWNGVALLSRVGEPVVVRTTLPGDASDQQARYLEAAIDGVVVACLYLPNGNPWPGPTPSCSRTHKKLKSAGVGPRRPWPRRNQRSRACVDRTGVVVGLLSLTLSRMGWLSLGI